MKTNLHTILVSLAVVSSFSVVTACGDSGGAGGGGSGTTSSTGSNGTSTSSSTSSSASTGTGGGFPAPPTLGATQIDRMGRPAINTATNDTFVVPSGTSVVPSDDATRAAAEDDYNSSSDSTTWAAKFAKTQAANLAILDALDGNCTNQLASCGNPNDATGMCYAALAGVLADDRLWVKTTSTTCNLYLGVEADGLGVIPNTDCGGRRPIDDVIMTTYSVVAIGAPAGFDDNITAPAGLHPDAFPFMAAPH